MPKKERSARRTARTLERKLIASEETNRRLGGEIERLGRLLRAADAANRRLSNDIMRIRTVRDGCKMLQAQVAVDETMMKEMMYEPEYLAQMLANQLCHEVLRYAQRKHMDTWDEMFNGVNVERQSA